MFKTSEKIPEGFAGPTALPQTAEETKAWQETNKEWWESHPMRYDWEQSLGLREFSKEFYEEIDRRFFATADEYMTYKKIPFDPLIPFDELPNMDVLEVGVGNGSHAALLAQHAKSFTGIDLTEYAVKSTTARMREFGLNATIRQMDAEKMDFPDNSFDFIWSWGVIHHSADTKAIIRQMHRVLRPGGRAVTMVYYRSWWEYYLRRGLLRGIRQGTLFRTGSMHKTVQLSTDGGLARYYNVRDWTDMVRDEFTVDRTMILGYASHVIPLPGALRERAARHAPQGMTRFLSNTMGLGQFLVAFMTRRD